MSAVERLDDEQDLKSKAPDRADVPAADGQVAASPDKRRSGGHGPNLSDEVEHLLLPTPKASDGTHGGPNSRGSKGDLTLPSAAAQLLPKILLHTFPLKHGRKSPELAVWRWLQRVFMIWQPAMKIHLKALPGPRRFSVVR